MQARSWLGHGEVGVSTGDITVALVRRRDDGDGYGGCAAAQARWHNGVAGASTGAVAGCAAVRRQRQAIAAWAW